MQQFKLYEPHYNRGLVFSMITFVSFIILFLKFLKNYENWKILVHRPWTRAFSEIWYSSFSIANCQFQLEIFNSKASSPSETSFWNIFFENFYALIYFARCSISWSWTGFMFECSVIFAIFWTLKCSMFVCQLIS